MRPRLVVAGFKPAKKGRPLSRWQAWGLWLCFAFFGMAIGLWRTRPDRISVGKELSVMANATSSRPVQTVSRSSSFIWPADGSVTSSFGWRIHPISGEELLHEGIDIAAHAGDSVHAAASGTVTYLGWYGGYGRLIVVRHADGLETRYGHLSGYEVSQGDDVVTGELIGYVGESGSATGPNLQFEIRRGGKPVDPRDYLP